MRKIVYSGIMKFIAAALLLVSLVSGVLTVTNGIITFYNEKNEIYSFERDFSESWYLSQLLDGPETAIYNAYFDTFGEYNNLNTEELKSNVKKRLEEFYNSDKINYYVQWNDVIFTNCEAEKAEDLMTGEYYTYLKSNGTGNVERVASSYRTRGYLLEDIARFDENSTIVISCNIDEEVVEEYEMIWERQEKTVTDTVIYTLIFAIIVLLLLIYLICVCGKNTKGEYENMWVDSLWTEVHLIITSGAGFGSVALCWFVLEEFLRGYFPQILLYWVIGTATALGGFVVTTSLFAVIRNIKTGRFIRTSIILRIMRCIIRLSVKSVKYIWRKLREVSRAVFRLLSKKTGIILIVLFFLYTSIIGIFGICAANSSVWIALGIVLFIVACFFVACRAQDIDEIKKGVSEIRKGNVAYKIPKLKCEDMKMLAANINDIATGLHKAVAAEVRAERLKTELITNVSHDLKTPITSIISYAELLSKVEGLPEEARDYVTVISRKGEGLKTLTQDLFDISKAQSGNDNVVFEKIDVTLLINQALGEQDNEIQSSGLKFCVETQKDLYISADGRKMSRVVGNLINNIFKYTMKDTRVFITASEKDGFIQMEFKNISAYPLDFNTEEITHRFVRGDKSRTTEGNGLGLAIAKSYTELCNGTFDVMTDGDMFKVIIKFKKYLLE